MGSYPFGDTSPAAERLAVLAKAFEPSTRHVLDRVLTARMTPARSVVDLGCGPGWTTHLLADVVATATVLGVDQSHAFLQRADRSATGRVEFRHADVTTDLGARLATFDLVYARFLLAHLHPVAGLVDRWFDLVGGGGHLVLEEPEWIDGPNVVHTYLDLSRRIVARGGADLFVGARLARLEPRGATPAINDVHEHDVPSKLAAAMFLPNLEIWGDDAVSAGWITHADRRTLRRGLERLASRSTPVRWGVRQVVLTNA